MFLKVLQAKIGNSNRPDEIWKARCQLHILLLHMYTNLFFCFAQRKNFIENVTYCTDLISRWSQLHTRAACIHLSRPQSFFCFGQRTIFIDNITHCFRDQSDLIWRPSMANYNEHSRAFLGLQIFWRRWGGNLNPISLSDFFRSQPS